MKLDPIRRGITAVILAAVLALGGATTAGATPSTGGSLAGGTTVFAPTAAKPVVKKHPASKTVNAGTQARFSVTASGKNVTVRWQQKPAKQAWRNIGGATRGTLTVSATPGKSGSQYRAVVRNAGGTVVSRAAKLTVVIAKPKILTPPNSQRVAAGHRATFYVSTTGYGNTHRWQRKSGETWTAIRGVTGPVYAVDATTANDGLVVRAVATNKSGSLASKAARLDVQNSRKTAFPMGHRTTLSNWQVAVTDTNLDATAGYLDDPESADMSLGNYRIITATMKVRQTANRGAVAGSELDVEFRDSRNRGYGNVALILEDGLEWQTRLYRGATATLVAVVLVPKDVTKGHWQITAAPDWDNWDGELEQNAWYSTS